MDWQAMFVGNYLAGVEFNGREPTFTIKAVQLVDMEDDKGRTKSKGTLSFNETERGLVLCKTNAICLAALFGRETDSWVGKRVTLFATDVKFGGETVKGIRIKGSPDIKAPIDVEVKLPKKRAFPMRMTVTAEKKPVEGAA